MGVLACGTEAAPERVSWDVPAFYSEVGARAIVRHRDDGCRTEAPRPHVDVRAAEALPDGGLAVAGAVSDACAEGFVTRIAADGLVTHRFLGTLVVDLSVDVDGDVLATGWGDARPMYWRIPVGDGEPVAIALPDTGVHAEPERVLPGPVIVGLFSPITSGVLDGWIVRREGDAWVEQKLAGGGYSGFQDATMGGDDVVAVGYASRTEPYQGWIVVDRNGSHTEQRLGSSYSILHTVAALPDGQLLVVGKADLKGFAVRLDRSLAEVERIEWPQPFAPVFEYAELLVVDDTAWVAARVGTLRHEITRIVVLRFPIGATMGPADVVLDQGTAGGALAHRSDGSVWLVHSLVIPVRDQAPSRWRTGPVAFVRLDR